MAELNRNSGADAARAAGGRFATGNPGKRAWNPQPGDDGRHGVARR